MLNNFTNISDLHPTRTFEYFIGEYDLFDDERIKIMNEMGGVGWEIIKIIENYDNLNGKYWIEVYYKREKYS